MTPMTTLNPRERMTKLVQTLLRHAAHRLITRPLRAAGREIGAFSEFGKEEVYEILPDGGAAKAVVWRLPYPFLVETHGHSFVVATAGGQRVGELRVQGEGAIVLHQKWQPGSGAHRLMRVIELRSTASIRATVATNAGQELVVDRGVIRPEAGWKKSGGERSLTYYLEEPLTTKGRGKLAVVFSAIGAPYDFTYNYRSSLANVDAYRLYILDDFGSQGSYYFADHRDEGIFDAVQELIRHVTERKGVLASNTCFVGSSKGGTAALAHGLVFGAGRIFAGAPQCFPGSYLRGASRDILTFIAGDVSEESVNWLDQLIPDCLNRRRVDPEITILVGQADSHLHIHVEPFRKLAQQTGLNPRVLVVSDLDHQNIGSAFGPYLAAALMSPGQEAVGALLPYQFARRGAEEGVQLKLWLPPDEVAAVRILTPERNLLSADYSTRTFFQVPVAAHESVRAEVTRMDKSEGTTTGSFETPWLPSRQG